MIISINTTYRPSILPCASVMILELLLFPPTKEEVHIFASVYLSVRLLARLLQNACMDFDEILRVDRCRDMDELIDF